MIANANPKRWLANLDGEHPHGGEVLSTIFVTA